MKIKKNISLELLLDGRDCELLSNLMEVARVALTEPKLYWSPEQVQHMKNMMHELFEATS